MASYMEWVVTPEQAWVANYTAWAMGLMDVVDQVLQARRAEIEEWMRANHPWQNRTHIAEEGLFAEIVRDGSFILLVIGHDAITYYSRFLERFMQSGKFSVLIPALDYWGPIIFEDLRRSFR